MIKPEWQPTIPDESINEIDRHIFDLHNELRQKPKVVIIDLQERINDYENEVYLRRSDGRSTLQTKDGVKAVYEAIEYLRYLEPVQPLSWSTPMAKACQDHVDDIGPKGGVSHQSTRSD